MTSSIRKFSMIAGLFLVGAAHGQVLVESFKNGTTTDPNWVFAGTGYTPTLTGDGVAHDGITDAVGDGWLRLTSDGGNQATSAYNNTSFSAAGTTIYASFEYASWGGTGADGIAFFLFDASQTFDVGANGGSLGYAQKVGTGADDDAGLAGGYIGVAIDEYGNFSNASEGRVGGPGRTADSISVRGDEASGYAYLGGSGTLATSIDTPTVGTRPTTVNTVQILLTATNQLTVTLQQGSIAAQTVLQLDLSASIRPENLKLGFTSGSGGANNFHEVRNIDASTIVASLWDNDTSDSTWGSADNWDPDNVPGVGADILFDNTFVSTNQTIDTESDRTVRSLNFDAGFDYTINNNTLIFDNGGVAGFSGIGTTNTNGSGDHTINSDLQANNDIFIRNNNTGALTLNGDLDTGGNTITFDGTGDAASENGSITGTGNIIKNDTGTLTLTGSNTYTGTTDINGGTVIAANNNSLGTTGSGTTIGASSTLALTNNITVAETLTNNGTLANTSGTNTFSGVVTGTGAVDVNGGQLTLSGNNTYTGTTDIGTGSTLVANNNNSLGSTAGGTTVDSGGTLSLTNNITVGAEALTNNGTLQNTSGTNSFGGDITGTGGVTLTEGQLTLSGTNTYSGATTIGDGTIALGGSDALGTGSDVSIASTGVLDLAGNSQAIGNLTAAEGATLDFGTPGGANTFVFDTYTPPASGIFVVNNWEDGTDQLATTVASQDVTSVYLSGIGVAEQQVGLTALGGSYGNGYLLTPVVISHKEWDGSVNKGWRNDNNWTTPVEPSTIQVALFDDLGQAQPLVNLNASYTIAGIEFGSLGTAAYDIYDKNNVGYTITLDGAIPFIQQKNALDQTIRIPGLILGNNTIADITGAGDLIISSDISETGGSNSLVRDGSGAGKLILSGDNTFTGGAFVTTGVVRAESNTALGTAAATVADTGTLEVGNSVTIANNITTAGAGDGGNGAIRSTDGTNTLTGVVSGTGGVQVDAGSLTLSGNNTYSGQTAVEGGTLIANNNNSLGTDAAGTNVETGGTLSLINNITIATEALALNGTGQLDNTTGTNTYGGVISGTGNVNVVAGQLTLANTNTYSGATDIATGTTLVATANNALGSGNLTINDGATLQLSGGIDVGQTNTNIAGTGTAGNGAIQNVSGNNRFSSDLTLTGNTTIESDAGTLNIGTNVDGSVYNGSGNQIALGSNTLTIDGAGDTVLKADLTGTGGITKDGDGTLTIANGTNSFTGTTQINDGETVLATYFNDDPGVGPLADFGINGPIVIGDGTEGAGTATLTLGTADASASQNFNNMLAGGVDVTINSDGRLDTRGHKNFVQNVDLDGGSINAQTAALGGNELYVTGDITSTHTSQTSTIDGFVNFNADATKTINVATGSTLDINARIVNGGIEKTGTGTLILSGGNTFTDNVDVQAGVTRVDNDSGLGDVAAGTSVQTGAQLQLDGVSIGAEALTINGTGISNTGALQTVASSGANSWAGNVTVGSTSEIEVSAASSLAITGNVTGSGQTLTIESIGDTTLSGTNTLNTLNKTGVGNLTVTTSPNTISTVNVDAGTFTVGTSNILNDSLDLNINGAGTLAMAGGINDTIDQLNSSGTLDIDGILTMNGGTISGGSGAGSTGELILTANNTLNITSDYDFGGTLELTANTVLALAGDGNQIDIGHLKVTGDTVIDFGAGENIEFNLGSLEITSGSTITVNNWNSFQDLWTTGSFTGGTGGVTIDERDGNTAQITFSGFSPTDTIWLTLDFGANEITVPESSSYGALLMTFGLAAWTLRRPRRSVSTV